MTQRNRTRTRATYGGFHQGYERNQSGGITNDYGNASIYTLDGAMSDVVTADFHKRVRKGEVIMNPLTSWETVIATAHQNRFKYTSPSGGSSYKYSDGNLMPTVVAHLSPTPGTTWRGKIAQITPQNDVDRAIKEVATAVRASQGTMAANYAEDLAEIRRTIGMLNAPFEKFLQFSRTNRRARFVVHGVLNAHKAWLAYRYGVRPLVRTVTSTLDELALMVNRKQRTIRREQITLDTGLLLTTSEKAFGVGTWTFEQQIREEITLRAMSIEEMVIGQGAHYGFTGKQILTTPWELLPASFVVDWFINVGDYINAIVGPGQANVLGQCLVQTRKYTNRTSTSTQRVTPGFNATWDENYKGHVTWTHTARSRIPALPAASVVIRNDFGLDRAVRLLDAISLGVVAIQMVTQNSGVTQKIPNVRHFRTSRRWSDLPETWRD